MRRPVLALAGSLAVLAIVAGVALAARGPALPTTIEIDIHYSHFTPSAVTVPLGVPVTFTLVNDDPIDHEWIVGNAAVQAVHRVGTELLHPSRPTELGIPALSTRTTTITFYRPAGLLYICHLPGHEAYGMVGTVTIVK